MLARQPRALARAATLIENRSPGVEHLLRSLFPHGGRAMIVGVTGPPGAGKSTFASRLTSLLRAEGNTVAVIAVDPTSPFSGGAVLGDRIRMLEHQGDEGVFVRSMASRGEAGGLAAATADLALLFDAAGFNAVLIETVGAGQNDVSIARLADATAVVLAPGFGDDVQAIKAGIMEIADIFLLNKADQPGIEQLERDVNFVLSLAERTAEWKPSVVRCSALRGEGTAEALAAIRAFLASGEGRNRRCEGWAVRLRQMYRDRLLRTLPERMVGEAAGDVAERRRDPWTVVDEWIKGAPQS